MYDSFKEYHNQLFVDHRIGNENCNECSKHGEYTEKCEEPGCNGVLHSHYVYYDMYDSDGFDTFETMEQLVLRCDRCHE